MFLWVSIHFIQEKYFDAKDGANNYYAKADECKTNALINFEKEIF